MGTKTKVMLGIGLLFLLGFIAAIGGFTFGNFLQSSLQTQVTGVDLVEAQRSCEVGGGRWLAEYSECENLDERTCIENNGKFNSCGSACRHNTDSAEFCVQVCVMVCSFNGEASGKQVVDESQNVIVTIVANEYTKEYIANFKEGEKMVDMLERLKNGYGLTFETKSFSFGDMLTTLNDIEMKENEEFWAFKVNGSDSSVGISDYVIKKGDKIEFVATKIQ